MSESKLKCPRCGKQDCSREHEGGSTSSFILCHNCGYKGNENSWKKQQNPFLTANVYAGGGVAEKNQAADKPDPRNDPDYLATREKGKRLRKDPKKRLQERQFGPGECETVRAKTKTMNKKAQEIERQEPLMSFRDNDASEFQKAKTEIGDAWINGTVYVRLKNDPKIGVGTVVQITSDPERPIKVQWAYDESGFPDQYGVGSGDFGIRKHSPLELQIETGNVMMGSSIKNIKVANINPFVAYAVKQTEWIDKELRKDRRKEENELLFNGVPDDAKKDKYGFFYSKDPIFLKIEVSGGLGESFKKEYQGHVSKSIEKLNPDAGEEDYRESMDEGNYQGARYEENDEAGRNQVKYMVYFNDDNIKDMLKNILKVDKKGDPYKIEGGGKNPLWYGYLPVHRVSNKELFYDLVMNHGYRIGWNKGENCDLGTMLDKLGYTEEEYEIALGRKEEKLKDDEIERLVDNQDKRHRKKHIKDDINDIDNLEKNENSGSHFAECEWCGKVVPCKDPECQEIVSPGGTHPFICSEECLEKIINKEEMKESGDSPKQLVPAQLIRNPFVVREATNKKLKRGEKMDKNPFVKKAEQDLITSLGDFIRSEYFDGWNADNQSSGGSGIILRDPERYDRINELSEFGGEGSTHGEVIQDWREAWSNYCSDHYVSDDIRGKVFDEIDKTENYHEEKDSLDSVIGSNKKINKKGNKKMKNLNPFVSASFKKEKFNPNPFAKEARDFRWTDEQIKRKEDKNMVFREGPQDPENLNEDKSDKKKGKDEKAHIYPETKKFDTVDRKEYRRSPDPKQMIPGYKEWYDANVDKYYPGWLDDHVENSGGSVPGSNTEKTMNLDDGEKHHAPVYPTEAVYEKLLESRHDFDDDYVRVVADNQEHVFTRKAADQIIELKKQEKPNLQRVIT